jgi:hypothetical protein
MDDKEKRFVDELLAASLRHYAGPEPRPGLEDRVLAGVRARQQAARRRMAWAWAVGMAAVAAMVTLLVMEWPRHQPLPLPVAAKTPTGLSTPSVAKVVSPEQPPLPHRPRRPAEASRVDMRPQQFPTPRPLSEQEKLLLAYMQSLQESSAAPASDADQDSAHDLEIPPLSIAAIKIEPLPPLGSGDEQ